MTRRKSDSPLWQTCAHRAPRERRREPRSGSSIRALPASKQGTTDTRGKVRHMKRRTVGLLATAAIIIVGAVFVMRRDGGGVSVETSPPRARRSSVRSVTASGQIVAQRYADIGSSVMGRLVELRVKEGDPVRAGQILARIDAVQAAASAAAASARVKGAEADMRAAADNLRPPRPNSMPPGRARRRRS